MSFSAEIFKNKLSVLDDSQDSIVSISQWVLFHHRHSKDAAKIWLNYISSTANPSASSLKNPSQKRLSLLYLCNDVVQQAKRKRKDEFIVDFAGVLPSALRYTYITVEDPIKAKIERLVNVWEERQVFAANDISKMKEAIESAKRNPHLESAELNASSTESINNNKIETQKKSNSIDKAKVSSELEDLNELYLLLSRLTDIAQTNLTQYGIQSKTYLPHDPTLNDSLPAPKAYISKLNTLEKISNASIRSIDDLKSVKSQIKEALSNLELSITESLKTDETKLKIIEDKLIRLNSTREELQEMIDEENSNSQTNNSDDEEPSPEFEVNNSDKISNSLANTNYNTKLQDSDDEDLVPTYDTDDDDDEDNNNNSEDHSNNGNGNKAKASNGDGEIRSNKKRRLSQTPSGGSTPSSLKRVAFSEDIEVKEYEAEDESGIINIVKSDDDTSDFDVYYSDNEDDFDNEFPSHHKDDLELKHDHDHADYDEYDPSLTDTNSTVSNNTENSTDIASILSKLS
ncbi:regulator of Ty1 transposition [Scheffersomyces coipomensis]|uniref:regulator of Ty1 transposition n=1 Tax=Scheffersomyces coipomensis TaxID=1788519 RepID=UPI00315CAEEE